jgi:hypothetical protein
LRLQLNVAPPLPPLFPMADYNFRTLLAAALMLPGLAAPGAQAQTAPEVASLDLRYLDYRDWQPGAKRIASRSPAFRLLTPVGEGAAFEATLAHDAISGASPLYHHTLSGASGKGVNDHRSTAETKFTRYFGGDALALSASVSSERDYLSRGGAVEWRHWSTDRNTAFTLGAGGADDRIDPVNGVARGSRRHSRELLAGLTQVLSSVSLLNLNLGHGRGEGYFSDPYKPLDRRPDAREHHTLQVRYHHHLAPARASLRFTYRYYRDTWAIRAHTLDFAWHQALAGNWWVMPALRYHTQTAAWFYHDPPFPAGWSSGATYSADTRLAAFGALAPALSVGRAFPGGWRADLRLEAYRQRAGWRPGGGSAGLAPFSARLVSFGLSRDF